MSKTSLASKMPGTHEVVTPDARMSGAVTPRAASLRAASPDALAPDARAQAETPTPPEAPGAFDVPEAPDASTTSPATPKLGEWLTKLPKIPFFFLGLGIYRAWIEITFVGSFLNLPTSGVAVQDVFDLSMVLVLLGCCFFARRIRSLLSRRLPYFLGGGLLLCSTFLMFVPAWLPQYAELSRLPAGIMGGTGIALLILMWSEIYGCLNPMRVALYYCASLLTAALLIYLARGLLLPWAFVFAGVLPVVSLLCVLLAFRSIPVSETPAVPQSWFSFPWKPTLLMAVYGLAFGLKEVELYASGFGPHSSLGTVVAALLIFAAVLVQGRRFDFALVYRIGLPLAVSVFLLLPSFGLANQTLTDFCISASYGSFSILTMMIFANMCYRYGISALWLFGFERGIRAVFVFCGRKIEASKELLDFTGIEPAFLISTLTVILLVALTMLLFSERELSSRWGVRFLGSTNNEADSAILHKQALSISITQVASKNGLTQREEEVLLLLAQGKSISDIERELFIANGTAKAHVRHIYKKLNIHSRNELLEMMGG